MPAYYIAFWNVENLFDVDGSLHRPTWLQKRLAKELENWDEEVLSLKLQQLGRIIRQMNNGQGPDVLGVCEVENERVLHRLIDAIDLADRHYDVAHADTKDGRGIDIAVLFDTQVFEKREQFSYEVFKREATRDLFQVTLRSCSIGRELIVIGNHWPSRRGGQYESEPYRILAGETLSYWLERIMDIKGQDTPVLVMGDFNDEPFHRALTDYALSTRQREKVLKAHSPRLYNLMWPVLGQGLGSHYYNNFANVLDQFLVTRGLLKHEGDFYVDEASVRIEQFPEMISSGYPDPIRFGRPASKYNPDGFSDHYPISVVVEGSPAPSV